MVFDAFHATFAIVDRRATDAIIDRTFFFISTGHSYQLLTRKAIGTTACDPDIFLNWPYPVSCSLKDADRGS